MAKPKKFKFDFAQAPEDTGTGSPDSLPDLPFPGDQRRDPAPGTSTGGKSRAPKPAPGTSAGTRAPTPAPGTSAGTRAPTPGPGSGSAHGKKLNR